MSKLSKGPKFGKLKNKIDESYYRFESFPFSDEFDDAEFGCCDNCGEKPLKVLYTSSGKLCPSCFVYFTWVFYLERYDILIYMEGPKLTESYRLFDE